MAFEKNENRNTKITIRLSNMEREILDELMKEKGFNSISDFIRYLIGKELD